MRRQGVFAMRQLVRVLFAISDFLCWALVCLGIVGALASPFALRATETYEGHSTSTLEIGIAMAWWALVAIGSFGLIKRKIIGVLPLFAPAIWLGIGGAGVIAIVCVAVIPVIILLPYALLFSAEPRDSRVATDA